MIAKIAVSAAIYAIDKPYSYRVPDGMTPMVGARVIVPFGRANKRAEGVILALTDGDESKLKPIDRVLDAEPLLDDRALHMAAFLRERYFCTFYDAVKAILPAGVWFQEHERYTVTEENWREAVQRQPVAQAVMQTLFSLGGAADYELLRRQFDGEALQKALHYLLQKRLITCETDRKRRVQDKTERIVLLASSAEDALQYAATKKRSAPLQTAVLELLATVGECSAKELCYYTGATNATLNRLEALGYLAFTEQERLRIRSVEPSVTVPV